MLLAIDIGNSLTDLGVYDGDELISVYKTKSDHDKSYEEYQAILALYIQTRSFSVSGITACIISCVVPALGKIWSEIAKNIFHCDAVVVGPHLKTGVAIKADHPREVGSDLVADAAGAIHKYGNSCVVADLGTASKVLIIDKDGAFAGVSIAPGFKISIEALVEKTAALPEVSLSVPPHVIGKNTEDAMNSGMVYGTAFEIRGLADAFEKEAGYPLKRILTGGNASYLKDVLPDFIYDESLLLDGLNEIYKKARR